MYDLNHKIKYMCEVNNSKWCNLSTITFQLEGTIISYLCWTVQWLYGADRPPAGW